jgi:hypothetical protein
MVQVYRREGEVPDDGVMVENVEGWGLLTGPLFGCIHWGEAKR